MAGRRPDPLAAVTDELRAWFDADPASTGRKLLERLQVTHPSSYPDGLVRTVLRIRLCCADQPNDGATLVAAGTAP